MKIPDTVQREGYLYATSRLSFGAFEKEDFLIIQIPTVILNVIGMDAITAFLFGFVLLLAYKKVTANQMSGHLFLAASNWFGILCRSKYGRQIPGMNSMGRMLAKNWQSMGSIPPPTYINFHER